MCPTEVLVIYYTNLHLALALALAAPTSLAATPLVRSFWALASRCLEPSEPSCSGCDEKRGNRHGTKKQMGHEFHGKFYVTIWL